MQVRLLSDDFDGAKLVDWPAIPPEGAAVILHTTDANTEFSVERIRWHLGSEGALIEVEAVLKRVPQVTSASMQII